MTLHKPATGCKQRLGRRYVPDGGVLLKYCFQHRAAAGQHCLHSRRVGPAIWRCAEPVKQISRTV